MTTNHDYRPPAAPLNPPDVPIERKLRELEGDRPPDDQAAYIDWRDTDALGATIVRLADEEEYSEICPDCEVGTAPPFGNLYDLPVYVSAALSASEQISFNGGTHGDVVRISYSDWQRLARPHAADISLSI